MKTNKKENIGTILVPVGGGKQIEVELDSTILVLNEYQKQWTEKGLYHKLIKGQLKERNVLKNVECLITHWRNRKLPIIHAPIIQDPQNKKGFLANVSNAGFFTKGTWKAEFTDGTYQKDDIVLQGRYTFNVFQGSNFDEVLKSNRIKTFFICGFTTSLCLKKTVEAARDMGYDFIIINDCSATFTSYLQSLFDKQFVENITSSTDVINCLKSID